MYGSSEYDLYRENGYEFLKIANGVQRGRTLIFLHGMFGRLSNFDPLLSRLQGETVLVPSIPLYDTEDDAKLTIPGLADWLHGFISSCGLKRCLLLGNSMGGHIALEYACRHPELLEGLVLTGSSGLFENDFGTTVPRRNDPEYIRDRARMVFYDDDMVTDQMVEELIEVIQAPAKLIRLLRVARSTHKHNMEAVLPQLDLPTLLVWGRDDVVTPPEVAEMFLELLPDARLHWIEQCGHAPMMEHPDRFCDCLKEFLSELNARTNQHEPKEASHL